jgi:hypothetical protein
MLSCAILALGLAVSVMAEEPPSVPLYYAVGVPDSRLPTISIDGDLSEWLWVPDEFVLTSDELNNTLLVPDDADDLSGEIILGWNSTTNKIYGAVHVHDSEHVLNNHEGANVWMDDTISIYLDPDNGGGGPYSTEDRNITSAVQFWMYAGTNTPSFAMYNAPDPSEWWYPHPPYIDHAVVEEGPEIYYEFAITPYDPLVIASEEESTLWQLVVDQVIGFSTGFSDADYTGLNQDGLDPQEAIKGGAPNYHQSSASMAEQDLGRGGYPDLYLSPVDPGDEITAVEASTWGQVKALMSP